MSPDALPGLKIETWGTQVKYETKLSEAWSLYARPKESCCSI